MNRICRLSTCRNRCAINEIYCEEHKGTNNRQYNKHIRYNNDNSRYSKFYHTTEWRKLRKYKLMINPLCEVCLEEERMTKAEVVDHHIELRDPNGGWEHRLDINNLVSMCNKHHNMKEHKHSQTHN